MNSSGEVLEFILIISNGAVRISRYMEGIERNSGLEASIVNKCQRHKADDPQIIELMDKQIVFNEIGDCVIVFGGTGTDSHLISLYIISELGDLLERYCGAPLQSQILSINADRVQILLTHILSSGTVVEFDSDYLYKLLQGVS